MCFPKYSDGFKQQSPKPVYRSFQIENLVLPKLPRNIVPNARVNLNDYWSQLVEPSECCVPLTCFDLYDKLHRTVFSGYRCTEYSDNEINENIINEFKELGNN